MVKGRQHSQIRNNGRKRIRHILPLQILPVLFLRFHDPVHLHLPDSLISFIEGFHQLFLIFDPGGRIHSEDHGDGDFLFLSRCFLRLPGAACGQNGKNGNHRQQTPSVPFLFSVLSHSSVFPPPGILMRHLVPSCSAS